jgi:beta-N-acetylhexosaminidase
VLPVIKHLPGHGRATCDSHLQLPRVEAGPDVLEATDWRAFRPLADLPLAMTAHIVFAGLDPDRPATQSPDVIQRVIRGAIGFQGLLISDDLSMQALQGPIAGRAAASIAAGCDLALHCNGDLDELAAVLAAVPVLPEGKAGRLQAMAPKPEEAAGSLAACLAALHRRLGDEVSGG